MTTDVHVRRFVPGDTNAVVALWEESFPDDPPRNAPRAVVARKVERDADLFWVAVEKADAVADPAAPGAERVVGVVLAGYDGYRGWLYHLAVSPASRRRGVATALVEHAVDALTALGCPKINLQVRESNAEVLAFYAALGWAEDRTVSLGRALDAPR